ncbi:MAG: hypothetical protein ACXW2P_02000, partial [Thermoanaerobaculia bacterium]
HGLLLGKYTETHQYPKGDFRSGVADFMNPEAIGRYRKAAEAMRKRFDGHQEPVLHAVIGALLSGNETACVLLGQRNEKQVRSAAAVGDALSPDEAAWVKKMYR